MDSYHVTLLEVINSANNRLKLSKQTVKCTAEGKKESKPTAHISRASKCHFLHVQLCRLLFLLLFFTFCFKSFYQTFLLLLSTSAFYYYFFGEF